MYFCDWVCLHPNNGIPIHTLSLINLYPTQNKWHNDTKWSGVKDRNKKHLVSAWTWNPKSNLIDSIFGWLLHNTLTSLLQSLLILPYPLYRLSLSFLSTFHFPFPFPSISSHTNTTRSMTSLMCLTHTTTTLPLTNNYS